MIKQFTRRHITPLLTSIFQPFSKLTHHSAQTGANQADSNQTEPNQTQDAQSQAADNTAQASGHSVEHNQTVASRIGLRLLSYLLAFSFVVTLATSSFILIADFQRGVEQYRNQVTQIRASYQHSISYSVWNFDTQQINSQLAGIINFPGVNYVYIETNNQRIHAKGQVDSTNDERHSFPLMYNNHQKTYQLGSLYIDISYSQLYQELKEQALQILATQFLKTFSVSIFVLFLVRQLITYRLHAMSRWAADFSLSDIDKPLVLPGRGESAPSSLAKGERYDELDQVADAINQMRQTLKRDYIERERSASQLQETKERLAIAIDNAALGFCQYLPAKNQLRCNYHFAHLLGASQSELETHPHPFDQLLQLISGDNAAEQRERVIQLQQGRLTRLQDSFTIYNLEGKLRYLDTTIQTTAFEENRPQEILICVVDKTKERNACQQAKELNSDLEFKVARRTEELYDEQLRAKASITQLQQELENLRNSQSRQQILAFKQLLLAQLNSDDPQQLAGLKQYLQATCLGELESIDLTQLIESWCTQHKDRLPAFNTHLPFSFILDENRQILDFLLQQLILTEPLLTQCRALDIHLNLHDQEAILRLEFYLQQTPDSLSSRSAYELCQHVVQTHLQGKLNQQLLPGLLISELSFSLSRAALPQNS